MEVRPEMITPSTGMLSPGRTRRISSLNLFGGNDFLFAACGMRCKGFSMPARAFATVSSSRRPPSRTPHRLQMTAAPDSASSVTSFLMPPSSKSASSFSISFFMSNLVSDTIWGMCIYTHRGIGCQEANKKEPHMQLYKFQRGQRMTALLKLCINS